MNIVLFEAFPDSYRQSMARYASCLRSALVPLLGPSESVSSFLPPVSVAPKAARYWSQYVVYPRVGRHHQGSVTHVVDHAYGHLARALDARRTVITVHDAIALKTRSGFIQWYNLRGICRAARIICVSEATCREFLRLSGYPVERIDIVHEGVGNEFFVEATGDPFERLGIPRARYILHVGHTMAYKNIPGLLKIFSILTRETNLDLRLLRAGSPFSRNQTQSARDLGIEGRILHLGYLPADRLPDLYRCADLLLFPSLDEGFGFPPLEAMACGLPVVASNRGALPETTGGAALLADPLDEETMARHAKDILKSAKLQEQLSEAGIQRAHQFTWEKAAQKTLAIYRRVHQENSNR